MNPVMIEKREKIWSGFAGHQYISAGLHSAGPRNGGIRYYLAVLAGRDRDIDIFTWPVQRIGISQSARDRFWRERDFSFFTGSRDRLESRKTSREKSWALPGKFCCAFRRSFNQTKLLCGHQIITDGFQPPVLQYYLNLETTLTWERLLFSPVLQIIVLQDPRNEFTRPEYPTMLWVKTKIRVPVDFFFL